MRVPCPVLLIQSGADQFISPDDQAEMDRRVRARAARDGVSNTLTIPGAPHLLGLSVMPDDYKQMLGEFLSLAF